MMSLWFYFWEKNGIDNIPWRFQMWQPGEIQQIRNLCIVCDVFFLVSWMMTIARMNV